MRVLVVSQYFWPEDFRINELVSELLRRGHDVTVLTGKPNYPAGAVFPDFAAQPERFSTYQGAGIVRVPMVPRGRGRVSLLLNYVSYALSATLFGTLRLWGEQHDAILVFEPSPVTVGLPAIALGRLKRQPIVFWVLDQWPETLSAVGAVRSKVLLRMVGLLVRLIYSQCDLILAPSRSLVERIRTTCRGRIRVAYFPNWAETVYGAGSTAAAREVQVREGVFNVMFAGNMGESQDFPAILDAAYRLRDQRHVRWLIVGDGRMAGWVRSEVSRRGLQENVVLLGRYPPNRMPSFFRHAGALLVSLRREPIFAMTIPGRLQSYLAFGVPLLGMLDGEGAEVIEESGAGLTCPAGDSSGLAEAVLRMAAMADGERSAMGSRGRAYAEREFDRDALVDRLEAWLVDLSRAQAAGVHE